jgi:hypothetical protein
MLFTRSLAVAVLVAVTIWFDVLRSEYPFLRAQHRQLSLAVPNANKLQLITNQDLHDFDNHPVHESSSGGDHPEVDDHHTDDELVTQEHGHPTLFKALSAIHVEIGTYAVFVIIGFIIIMKQMIELLLSITEDTPFAGMIAKIEEELMIVGTSSFIFKVILNTTDFGEENWAYPLEFAEILVPLISFSYCGLGLVLVLISLEQCFAWSRAHNLKTLEVLDDYLSASKSIFFR